MQVEEEKLERVKYQDYYVDMAYWMARNGLTNKGIADELCVEERTIDNWKSKYPEFAEAIKRGGEDIDRQVENAMLRRALGYEYEEITEETGHIGGKDIDKIKKKNVHIPADAGTGLKWLQIRQPEKWRYVQEVNVNLPDAIKIINSGDGER